MRGARLSPRCRRRFIIGILICLCLAAAALLFAPPFQNWLLRRAVAYAHRPWQLSFDRLGVGPTGLRATGMNFSMPGVSATSEPLTIQLAPVRLLSRRELSIERVEAQKIRVVLTPEEIEHNANQPFEGVLRLLQIPLRWELDAAHLDGEIIVREGGASRVTGHFSLRGGGLGPSAVGSFSYELTANSLILPVGPGHEFASRGTIRVAQTQTHGVGRVELDGDLRLPAYGPFTLPVGSVHATIEATSGGEIYHAQIAFDRAATLELAADVDAARHLCSGQITVHANQDVLTPLLHERVPHLTVDGAATVTYDLSRGDWQLALQETLAASELENAAASLLGLKGATFAGKVSLRAEKQNAVVKLETFDAAVDEASGARLKVNIPKAWAISSWIPQLTRSNTPASLNASEPGMSNTASADKLGVHIELTRAPLRWLGGFASSAGVEVDSGLCDGGWDLELDQARRIQIGSTEPTIVSALRLRHVKLGALPELQLAFRPSLLISKDEIAATLQEIEITSPNGDRIRGGISAQQKGTSPQIISEGNLSASIPSILANAKGALPVLLTTDWKIIWAGGVLGLERFAFRMEPIPSPPGSVITETPLHAAAPLVLALQRPFALRRADGVFKIEEAASQPKSTAVAGSIASKGQPSKLLTLTFDHAPLSWATPDLAGAVSGQVDLLDGSGALFAQLNVETSFKPPGGGLAQPVAAALSAHFHPMTTRILAADTFSLRLAGPGEDATLTAPQPFIFGLSNSGSFVCSTLQPLKLHLDQLALKSVQPWFPSFTLSGKLTSVDLLLAARGNHYTVEAPAPFQIEHLAINTVGATKPLFEDAAITFSPHLDLLFLCETRPKFQFAYQGQIGASRIAVSEGMHPVLTADGTVGFKGNERRILVDTVDFNGLAHLGAVPRVNHLGLPAAGELSVQAKGDLLGDRPLQVQISLADLPLDHRILPRLTFALEGNVSSDLVLKGQTRLDVATVPVPSDLRFDARLNLVDGNLNIASGLHSQFLDLSALEDFPRAFAQQPSSGGFAASSAKYAEHLPVPPRSGNLVTNTTTNASTLPFWGELRGSFDLDLAHVQFAPYHIDGLRGRLVADDRTLRLEGLTGEMFAGRWDGDVSIAHDPARADGEHDLTANFDIVQFDSARVVQTVFPNQLASVDAKIDVHARVLSHGHSFNGLVNQSRVDFSVAGEHGIMHLTVPRADMLSSAAVFGGTILLSPELRALGRLIKKLAEMPMDHLSITGARDSAGEISLQEFVFDSPQLRLRGRGHVAEVAGEPLMNRPLQLSLELAAKDEIAVILNGMQLLTKTTEADGYRALRKTITIAGRTGSPDTTPLYDLLAQAVTDSHGTWGLLMRRLQDDVKKPRH